MACSKFIADIEFLPLPNQYKSILYINDFWNLNSDMYPINTSTPYVCPNCSYQLYSYTI